MFYVYVLKLNNGYLYIGFTTALKNRLRQHHNGESKYTKNFRPLSLVYYEAYASETDARAREISLKKHKGTYGHLKKRIARSISKK